MALTSNNVEFVDVGVVHSDSVLTEGDGASGAVSWAAIVAGAVAATGVTLILFVLGIGVGLSSVSPWYDTGASAKAVGVAAVIWLVVVQWLSSSLGGFLAGRLRTKWLGVHTHEVSFRDTAHGFLAWALASVGGAIIFAVLTAHGLVGPSMQGASKGAVSMVANGVQSDTAESSKESGLSHGNNGYFVDSLFRSTNAVPGDKNAIRGETMRILANSTADGQIALSPADAGYLAQLVSAQTGLSPADAQQRVTAVVQQANDAEQKILQVADAARKRAAQIAIVTALSMLIGAFIASAAGALGGSIRDEY